MLTDTDSIPGDETPPIVNPLSAAPGTQPGALIFSPNTFSLSSGPWGSAKDFVKIYWTTRSLTGIIRTNTDSIPGDETPPIANPLSAAPGTQPGALIF